MYNTEQIYKMYKRGKYNACKNEKSWWAELIKITEEMRKNYMTY